MAGMRSVCDGTGRLPPERTKVSKPVIRSRAHQKIRRYCCPEMTLTLTDIRPRPHRRPTHRSQTADTMRTAATFAATAARTAARRIAATGGGAGGKRTAGTATAAATATPRHPLRGAGLGRSLRREQHVRGRECRVRLKMRLCVYVYVYVCASALALAHRIGPAATVSRRHLTSLRSLPDHDVCVCAGVGGGAAAAGAAGGGDNAGGVRAEHQHVSPLHGRRGGRRRNVRSPVYTYVAGCLCNGWMGPGCVSCACCELASSLRPSLSLFLSCVVPTAPQLICAPSPLKPADNPRQAGRLVQR